MGGGHVAHVEAGRGAYRDLLGKSAGKRPLGSSRRRLQWIFIKWDGGMTGLIWLRMWTGGGVLCMG